MPIFQADVRHTWVLLLALTLEVTGCEPHPPRDRSTSPRLEKKPSPAPIAPIKSTAQVPVEPGTESPPQPLTPARPDRLPNLGISGPVRSRLGVVTSVERQASEAGIRILKAGGNAADAAVAAAFALAVTHPSAGNLAGGGFALVRRGSQIEAVDFREDSPRSLTSDSFYAMLKAEAKTGAAVGIPGTVAGLLLVHSNFGRLSLSEVLAPAEELATKGYVLGGRQHQTIEWAKSDLARDPVAQRVFFHHGKPKPAGSLIRRPDLAIALGRIRERGKAGFYEGPTAADIIGSLGGTGLITLDDLKSYSAKLRKPLESQYRGIPFVTMPPPSAGGVALIQILGMLEDFELKKSPRALVLHYFAEASRRAQVERRLFVAAPERYSAEDFELRQARWLNPKTWTAAHPIEKDLATSSAAIYPSSLGQDREEEHTTHLSAVDGEGQVVSLTVTLSASYGTRIFTRETGMALNNSVASFSSEGDNTPRPGVRTTSSMAPTLLVAENETVALGSPGGDTIPSTIALTLIELIDREGGLLGAVGAPRVHQGLFPDVLETERSHPLDAQTAMWLGKLGHNLRATRHAQGDANLSAWISGEAHAVADLREGGRALSVGDSQNSEPPK
jgi:gamma-glutamyltranspeptidase / glutathione hydrolase